MIFFDFKILLSFLNVYIKTWFIIKYLDNMAILYSQFVFIWIKL